MHSGCPVDAVSSQLGQYLVPSIALPSRSVIVCALSYWFLPVCPFVYATTSVYRQLRTRCPRFAFCRFTCIVPDYFRAVVGRKIRISTFTVSIYDTKGVGFDYPTFSSAMTGTVQSYVVH